MKKIVISLMLCFSVGAQAAKQCSVDIKNEVHLDGHQVEIVQPDASKVLIDQDNNVFINGEKLDLNQAQIDAIESYREHMNKYVPQVLDIARDGLELAQNALDEIAVSFNNSEAFNSVKEALEEFFNGMAQRYQKDEQFILQEAAFSDAVATWKEDFAAARETFNAEFFSSAFTAISEQMNAEGGLNLTELKDKLVELQANLTTKLEADSKEIEKDAKQYCGDLEAVAEEEKMLHEKIPELKDYQVFLI
ncbi:DUF2884 family protein [Vibrio algarum]|uniref:DUF2884 family protein n=1 Tax=Vibrio algarum TaxID=3020714 RepID=A0ABT4YP80_9VIBR|nr:DUF2884 family protein [Vibrio sp. KJ40-1]MDB1123195.1 DUF2884 family protein [Vibrio sp. KJ40-1]